MGAVFFQTGSESWGKFACDSSDWSLEPVGASSADIRHHCHAWLSLPVAGERRGSGAARANVSVFFGSEDFGTGGASLIIIQRFKALNSFSAQSKTFTRLSSEPFNPGDSCHSLYDSDTSATSQLISEIRQVLQFMFPFPL